MYKTDLPNELQDGKILLIDKELKWTSFDVVNKIRIILKNQLGIKKIKVGHAGTLDPLATGLIIICTGKATKKIEEFINLDKEYIGVFRLGETTPSFDLETQVDKKYTLKHIDQEKILGVIQTFIGEHDQVPPAYSAKYVNGTRAYEFARRGENIKLKPNRVNIFNIELLSYKLPDIKLKIMCSKGTYIRSLARDLGEVLKCGSHLTELRRTRIGNFDVRQACLIKDFEKTIKDYVTI